MLQVGNANNQILGNVIGTNGDGSAALPNGDGGIWVLNTPGTRIGSGTPGEGNSISGNGGEGILVQGATSAGAVIEGNEIGVDQPNTADGIHLGNQALDVTIGGAGSAGNTIRSNAGAGIAVFGSSSPANEIEILGNAIFGNGGLGIDLDSDGVTANDVGDGDSGPNGLLNFPVVTSAVTTGGVLDIEGNVDTSAGTGAYRVDFFRSTACNAGAPNDFGEGEAFLGSQTLNAATTGGVGFDNTLFSAPPGRSSRRPSHSTATRPSSRSAGSSPPAPAGPGRRASRSRHPRCRRGVSRRVTVTITVSAGPVAAIDSITATLPAGYSFVRNSTRVDGSYIDDGMDNEPPSLGGALVWPRAS